MIQPPPARHGRPCFTAPSAKVCPLPRCVFAVRCAARSRCAPSCRVGHNRDAGTCAGEVDPPAAGDPAHACEICGCEQPARIVGYRSDALLR